MLKTTSLRYIFEKVPSAKRPHKQAEQQYVDGHMPFRMYFTIRTSILKLRPLVRFLCLTDTFCRTCVYNTFIYICIYIYIWNTRFGCLEKPRPGFSLTLTNVC